MVRPLRLVILGLSLLTLAFAAQAEPKFAATVQASSGTLHKPGPTDYKFNAGSAPQSLAATSTQEEDASWGPDTTHGEGRSSAFAQAGPGGLRIYAGAVANVAGAKHVTMNAQGAGSASASGDDSFIIWAPECTTASLCGAGSFGTMSFSIAVTGGIGGSGNNAYSVIGQWTADMSLSTGWLPGAPLATSASWHGDQAISRSNGSPPLISEKDGFGVKTFTVSFAFGTPINLHLAATATAQASASQYLGNANAVFVTDLGHTLAWGGISSVTDAAGNAVAFTALSAGSGFDYAQPFASSVPEPTSALLFGAGLGLLVLRRSRSA